MVFLTGPSQAATVAAAVEKPTYFRKSLRLVEDPASFSLSPKNSSTGICSLNSFCFSVSIMESLGSSSASLFQYFLFDAIAIYLGFCSLFLIVTFCTFKTAHLGNGQGLDPVLLG